MIEDAYAAGIFDGEGWVGMVTRTRGGYKRIQLEVQMFHTNRALVRWYHDRYGGSVVHRNGQREGYREAWGWRTSTRQAEIFLERMAPYLIVKRLQVQLALEYCAQRIYQSPLSKEQWAMREGFQLAIKEANRRGTGAG